ncbi:MAG: hypothetical protein ACT452_18335 [Microthrixaceae bacterium]
MPAETHQEREPIDACAVLDLIGLLLAGVADASGLAPETPLKAVGVDDDVAIFRLWDAVSEELAERGFAEPDIDDLHTAETIGELADAIVRSLQRG